MFSLRPAFIVAGLPACLALASCVIQVKAPPIHYAPPPAVAPPALERGELSGQKQQIYEYYQVDPDCSSAGLATITVVTAPTHGHISVEPGEAYPNFPRDNIRWACNNRKVRAAIVYYTSEPGFAGSDAAQVEVLTRGGMLKRLSFTISVR